MPGLAAGTAEKIGTCADFETAERSSGTVRGMMDPVSKQPPSSVACPSEPPSGIRLRTPIFPHTPPADGPPRGVERCTDGGDFYERQFIAFVKVQINRVPEHARALRIPEDRAEDILQRSLEKLFPHRAEIESSRWESWLRSAMRLRSLDHFRGVRRARKYEQNITSLLQDWQSCGSPEVDLYQRECARELLALLDRLTPERREVVCLYLIDDLSMEDVAERLGIPFDTAKNRWRLAALDMGIQWERDRARERSNMIIAALMALGAFFLAFWRRIGGSVSRGGRPLLACAACALAFTTHAESEGSEARRESASAIAANVGDVQAQADASRGDGGSTQRFASDGGGQPPAEARPSPSANTSVASGSPGGAAPARNEAPRAKGRAALEVDAAHKYLASITELRNRGNIAAARKLLSLYRLSFPQDPLPQEHARVAASLATP